MTLADTAEIELTERAWCLLAAAARRSRPRVSPRTVLERLVVAAEPRETAVLMCSRCERPTAHVHARDVELELAGQVARIWRCGCGQERQCGAVAIGEQSDDEAA